MKVVACRNCGVKYQIEDNEDLKGYECSACAGELKEIEKYPSNSYKPQDNSLYDPNLAYCSNCGLKYRLEINDNIEDFECSSCFNSLQYMNESLNKSIDKKNIRNNEENLSLEKNKQLKHDIGLNNDQNKDSEIFISSSSESENMENNPIDYEEKLRKQIKNGFSRNLDKNYFNEEIKTEDIEEIIRRKLKEEKLSKESNGISNKLKNFNLKNNIKNNFNNNNKKYNNKNINNINNNIHNEDIIEADINNVDNLSFKQENNQNSKEIIEEGKFSVKKSPHENVNLNNSESKKQELVPIPNIKNRSYHDVYIIVGLLLALIGLIDMILSERIYGLIFIGIGVIIFIIGVIKNVNHNKTENRSKIIRENLLSLPENFYVLYYVKVPNSSDGINHVVIGPSGIFSIITHSYKNKENKAKTKVEIESEKLINKSNISENNIPIFENDSESEFNDSHTNSLVSNISDEKNKSKKDNNAYNNTSNNTNNNSNNNETKFRFDRDESIVFYQDSKIKQKSIELSENLMDFLIENGLSNVSIEPLVGFVNEDVVIINRPLVDEDLFLTELLDGIINGETRLDDKTIHKSAVLLSQYSTECSS